jgi:hypothetical protein
MTPVTRTSLYLMVLDKAGSLVLALDKFVLINPNFIHNSIYNKTDNALYRTVDILHELLKVRSVFFRYQCLTHVKLL